MARFVRLGLADKEHQRKAKQSLRQAKANLRATRWALARGDCAQAAKELVNASVEYGMGIAHAHSSSKGVKTGRARALLNLSKRVQACVRAQAKR